MQKIEPSEYVNLEDNLMQNIDVLINALEP